MTTEDVFLLAILFVAVAWVVRRRRGFTHLRGVRLASMRRALALAWHARLRSPRSVRFGLRLPIESMRGSYLILGASQSGKTVLLNLFRQSLLPLFADPAESLLLIDFDPKRDNRFWARSLPPDVPYFDLSPSVYGQGFDLFGDCEHDGDLVTVADALLPEVKNDHQPHFRNTAVLLLVSVLRAARWHGHRLTLRQVVLIGGDLKDLRRYLKSCPATAPVVTAHLNDGDEAMSVFATLSSGVNRYRTVAAAWSHADRSVTVSEFLSLPKAVLNLPYEDDAMPVLAPILRLILMRLEQKVLKQNRRGRRVVFLLDEYRILRDIRLYLLACKGAEAGVSLFYACQSYVGACEAHGEPIVKELFGLAKNRIFLRLDGYDDALYASKSLGRAEGYMTLFNKGGWGESSHAQDNVEPGTVMNLPLPTSRDLVIRGFGTTPYTRPFRFRFPFRKHLAFLDDAKSVPPLPSRPAAQFDLLPLAADERRELGLK